VSWHQIGETNLDCTEARDGEWQWHQLGHMQVCTSLQTDNHASTPPLSFLQVGCPSCRPTNSVKTLKALSLHGVTAQVAAAVAESAVCDCLVGGTSGSECVFCCRKTRCRRLGRSRRRPRRTSTRCHGTFSREARSSRKLPNIHTW